MANGKVGAPVGNQNGIKNRPWAESLKRALARAANGTVDKGLDKIADQVVSAAMGGEKDAWQEIANRLDGKPTQQLDVEAPQGIVVKVMQFGNSTTE